MNIRTLTVTLVIFICSAFMTLNAAIDQTYVERILKENNGFIDFIDTCVTNFAPDKKDVLFGIYEKHFNAEIMFLQGEYKKAFNLVYESQKDMAGLYEYILNELYLEDSKKILGSFAPLIIRSKNTLARQYLTLGYRDRTLAVTDYKVGEASHPELYSYKIFKYRDAINYARRSKRYALLSLYTSQDIDTKRKIYNLMLKRENEKKNPFFSRFVAKFKVGTDQNDPDKKEVIIDDEYIVEKDKPWEKYMEENGSATDSKTTGNNTDNKTDVKESFEGKVARQVRFRKEQQVARYLQNGEFDKAEPVIREYVDEYNFKLILSTLEYLSSADPHGGEGATDRKIDYSTMINQHRDNYHILKDEKSVLQISAGKVRVLDDMDTNKDKENIETKKDNENIETPGK